MHRFIGSCISSRDINVYDSSIIAGSVLSSNLLPNTEIVDTAFSRSSGVEYSHAKFKQLPVLFVFGVPVRISPYSPLVLPISLIHQLNGLHSINRNRVQSLSIAESLVSSNLLINWMLSLICSFEGSSPVIAVFSITLPSLKKNPSLNTCVYVFINSFPWFFVL